MRSTKLPAVVRSGAPPSFDYSEETSDFGTYEIRLLALRRQKVERMHESVFESSRRGDRHRPGLGYASVVKPASRNPVNSLTRGKP